MGLGKSHGPSASCSFFLPPVALIARKAIKSLPRLNPPPLINSTTSLGQARHQLVLDISPSCFALPFAPAPGRWPPHLPRQDSQWFVTLPTSSTNSPQWTFSTSGNASKGFQNDGTIADMTIDTEPRRPCRRQRFSQLCRRRQSFPNRGVINPRAKNPWCARGVLSRRDGSRSFGRVGKIWKHSRS